MILTNASMVDVLSVSALRDSCVVLPTLEHAVEWWNRVKLMIDNAEPNCLHTRTAIVRRRSNTALRLWVPFERRDMPMDFDHNFVYRCDYLLLYGLSPKGAVKWLR